MYTSFPFLEGFFFKLATQLILPLLHTTSAFQNSGNPIFLFYFFIDFFLEEFRFPGSQNFSIFSWDWPDR